MRVNILLDGNDAVLAGALRDAGHAVAVASKPEETWKIARTRAFDAIVVGGRSRPDTVSLTVCSDLLRSGACTPVLLRITRDVAETRSEGLDAGADDCVSLSCPVDELLARLRALVRRAAHGECRKMNLKMTRGC